MRGWANNVWGVAYRSCTRAQNDRVNCAPFNFRTSVKASDSEPEPVFDVFLKTVARNDEVSALGRKDDLRVRYPRSTGGSRGDPGVRANPPLDPC